MSVKPIPDGYSNVTPYLIIEGAAEAIAFYEKAFGAKERLRMPGPKGLVGHAEIVIGDSAIMLADAVPEMNIQGPKHYGGSPIGLHLYVEDVDAVFKQAIEAGGTEGRALETQFYGDRSGMVKDPFGYHWFLASRVEDVPEDELRRRAQAKAAQAG